MRCHLNSGTDRDAGVDPAPHLQLQAARQGQAPACPAQQLLQASTRQPAWSSRQAHRGPAGAAGRTAATEGGLNNTA